MHPQLARCLSAFVPFEQWEAETFPAEVVKQEAVVEGDQRPQIELPTGGNDPQEFSREIGQALAKSGLYMRAGGVWFHDKASNALQPMTAQRIRYWMLQHVRLVAKKNITVRDDEDSPPRTIVIFEPVLLSADGASGLLLAPHFLNALPEIARVSQVPLPVWRGDKIRLLPTGYDKETKTLVINDVKLKDMTAPEAMTGLMTRWLGEFPFTKEDGPRCLSTVVAGMLAPFCELLVPAFAQRPAFVFTANREGGGKTLLARLCVCPVHGKVTITPPPEKATDAELKKLLGSVARAGLPYLVLDNWKGDIESASLEAFITSNIWGDRTLGVSELFTVEKSCLVYVTGNAAKVSPDMRRRALFVELFVEEVRTETRHIKRRIDEEDIVADQDELLSYLWAIVRHWDTLGRPKASIDHGTFGRWGHVVGSMAEVVTGVCPLTSPAYEGDTDLAAFERLLEYCMEDSSADKEEYRPAELIEMARATGGFERIGEHAPEEEREKRAEAGWFGRLCMRFSGSKFTKFRFAATATSRQHRKWVITRIE